MKKKILIGVFIFIFLFLLFYILFIDNVKIVLNGDDYVVLEYGEEYNDLGIVLKNKNKVIDSDKYEFNISSNILNDLVGIYTVNYEVKYKDKVYNSHRTVEIKDTKAPVITVNLETLTKDYCTRQNVNELVYSALDNYDQDISDRVEVVESDDKLILKVSDSSGNVEIKELDIDYTKEPDPDFHLNGNSRVFVPINGTYNEAGASYFTGCGTDLSEKIVISGTVNTSVAGDYVVTYSNDVGNSISRTVTVYEKASDVYGEKVIYLTFDDGPGYFTRSIIDTLNKYNVKATFFVTNQFPDYAGLIADEYNSGHAVAVHTYSHNYNVYSSVDAYVYDFNLMNEVIKSYTGSYSRIFRFPGGSSNTISRSYRVGVVSEIANRMTNDGYVYFDWNVDSTDAAGADSNTIYNRVVNGVNSCSQCVVLMHDIKGTTAGALDSILSTLVPRGYIFATLNESSFTAHHGINN